MHNVCGDVIDAFTAIVYFIDVDVNDSAAMTLSFYLLLQSHVVARPAAADQSLGEHIDILQIVAIACAEC